MGGSSTARWPEPTLVDPIIKRIAIVFRMLGLGWMALLVILGLTAEPGTDTHIGRPWIAIAALALATGWTLMTGWATRSDLRLQSVWFVTADSVIALAVGAASAVALTDDLFHGGYPMSSVVVSAAAGGFRWALPVSLVLGLEQTVVRLGMGRTASGAAFAIVFPFMAVVAGWGFDALRQQAARTSAAEAEKARLQERTSLATQLHDSVLQTLHAIRIESSNPEQVNYLARRQERELKRVIEQFLSPYDHSFRVSLLTSRICMTW